MLNLERRFEKKAPSVDGKSIYLDKYSGEWFAASDERDALIARMYEGMSQADLNDLSIEEIQFMSSLARNGVLGARASSPKPVSPHRSQVTLVIIEAASFCNLACTYCFEDVPTKGERMTFETAEAIVRSFQRLNLADTFVVEFNGGESFANFQTMKHIVSLVEASGLRDKHQISYGVTSNLTVLRQEMVDFLKEHRFSLSVSLDGIREDHDRHRIFSSGAGSHDRVLRNMQMLTTAGVEFSSISVISVPGQLTRAYDFLKRQRVPYASFAIRRHSERSPLGKVDYETIAEELVEAFVDSYESFKAERFAPKVMDAVTLIRNLVTPHDPQYMCLRTPCGAGTNMITYDTAGDIYACQDLIKEPTFKICGASEESPQVLIDTNEVVQRLRERKPGGNRGCEDCDFQMFCQGGCYSTSYFAAGKDLEASFWTKTPHCEFYYSAFSRLLTLMAKDTMAIPQYLQSTPYLDG